MNMISAWFWCARALLSAGNNGRCGRTAETKASLPKVGIGRRNAADDATKSEWLEESDILTDTRRNRAWDFVTGPGEVVRNEKERKQNGEISQEAANNQKRMQCASRLFKTLSHSRFLQMQFLFPNVDSPRTPSKAK